MKRKLITRITCILLAAVCLCGCVPQQVGTSGQQATTLPSSLENPTQSTPGEQTVPTTQETLPPTTAAPTAPTVPTTTAPTIPPTTVPPTTAVPEAPPVEVFTFEGLAALAAGESLQPGDTVHLKGDMEIAGEIIFTVPVSLSIEACLTCSYPIAIETFVSGMVEIAVADGVDASGLDIRLDAPNCDVLWDRVPYATEELAAEMTNVATFNGVDLRAKYGLGGAGENEILSFTMEAKDNAEIDSALSWQVEGNVLYLAVSYLTSDIALKNARVQIATSDGKTVKKSIELLPGERYYTVSDSAGNTRTYKIITERITYNLPVFYIEIENGQEVTSREEYLNATLRIDTEHAAGDFPGLETSEILIRGRGHYSWKFDKKPYKLRFEKKTSVLGMKASKNWTLLANYADRSLIQNYVAMEMGKVMDNIPYHSTQYPVDVFVNGTYRGVYTFGEQLEAKKERIDLEESYIDPDTDYLLEVGGSDEGDVPGRDYFHAGTLKFVAIKHPETEKLQQAQLDFLIDYVTKADEAVRTLGNYEDYIDVDSLIDWVIIHELTYNLDCCFRRSCYLIKEKGGKLKMGPIWDFDLAFGSHYRYQSGDWATVGEQGGYVGITWMNYLKEDPAFMARLTARWNEVKAELLETALTSVDTMGALVRPSAEMNFEVWDILGVWVPSQPSSHNKYDTHEKMVQRLRTFIQNRYNWLDKQLNG